MTRSIAHARFAISSRMNSTSSSGAPSVRLPAVGGRKNRFETGFLIGSSPGRRRYDICHIAQFDCGSDRSPIGRSSVRTPKLSVTTRESMRVSDPIGSVSGTTNQSLP